MLLPVFVAAALAASRTPSPPPPLAPCGGSPLATFVDPPALLAALAAPTVDAVSPWRAHVRSDVPVSLAPGVHAYPGDGIANWREVVVLAAGEQVTFVTREGPVNLVLTAPNSAFAPVVTRPVALAPSPEVAASPMHVDLTAGAEVKVLGGAAGFTEVSWSGEHLVATGWLPSDALGVAAVPCGMPDELHDVELNVGGAAIEVRDAPDGRLIALVSPNEEWMARSLGKTSRKSGAWTALVWTDGPMRVAGWVPSTRVKATARAHLYRTRHWVDTYSSEQPAETSVVLPAGAVLTADGSPFARLVEPAALTLVADAGGSVRVRLRTAWGSLEGETGCVTRSVVEGTLHCSP